LQWLASIVLSDIAATRLTWHNRHLQLIDRKDQMGWQEAPSYNKRGRVEASTWSYFRVSDDGIRARMDRRWKTGLAVAVDALNRISDLGRSN
jgi:hypothetical protein